MELIVKEITFPEVIEFNFDEIKQELQQKMKQYEKIVYTDDQVQIAKTDLANLRKFVKALSDERIRIKNECLKPYTDFEAKIKELDAIVQKPIEQINNQVKAYEEETKAKKRKDIETFWENTEIQLPIPLTLDRIFNEKWLNASVKMPAIEKEITERLEQIANDLKTLQNLPEFSFEAVEVYKATLDINKAITEGQRLSEIQMRKAEAEAKAKAEAEARARAEAEAKARAEAEKEAASAEVEITEAPAAPSVITPEETNKQWVSFKALLSREDALALKQFFNDRNIVFEKI